MNKSGIIILFETLKKKNRVFYSFNCDINIFASFLMNKFRAAGANSDSPNLNIYFAYFTLSVNCTNFSNFNEIGQPNQLVISSHFVVCITSFLAIFYIDYVTFFSTIMDHPLHHHRHLLLPRV